ncbi:terminase large subunit [Vibrio phage vB_VnaS-AQKL99]|nr:terminase large subunit [Vibrio phage vB_VnaS-AQKL99]
MKPETSGTTASDLLYNVIWEPQPGSQTLATSCPCNHILMEGTRGGGKTDNQIMFFRRFVGIGYGAFWRGVIFDREYKNLDDLIVKSQRWFQQFKDGAKFLKGGGDYKWVWPTGEELLFRQMKTEDDYWKYHGQEFPFIGWNELTKQPNSNLYDMIMSCNRSSFLPREHTPRELLTFDNEGNIIDGLLPELPLVVFSTTNPYGVGHNWVKQRFVDPAPPGVVVRNTKNVFNPRTGKREDITKTQVRIFSSYKENRFLSP